MRSLENPRAASRTIYSTDLNGHKYLVIIYSRYKKFLALISSSIKTRAYSANYNRFILSFITTFSKGYEALCQLTLLEYNHTVNITPASIDRR